MPVLRPILAEPITIAAIPATPTPAIEADPRLPTHIISMVGPSIMMTLLTVDGHVSVHRLPVMLPFVRSLSKAAFFLPCLSGLRLCASITIAVESLLWVMNDAYSSLTDPFSALSERPYQKTLRKEGNVPGVTHNVNPGFQGSSAQTGLGGSLKAPLRLRSTISSGPARGRGSLPWFI